MGRVEPIRWYITPGLRWSASSFKPSADFEVMRGMFLNAPGVNLGRVNSSIQTQGLSRATFSPLELTWLWATAHYFCSRCITVAPWVCVALSTSWSLKDSSKGLFSNSLTTCPCTLYQLGMSIIGYLIEELFKHGTYTAMIVLFQHRIAKRCRGQVLLKSLG